MGKEQSSIKERERTGIREPKRYKVILHNDDFTTMDFVVMILVQVFFKTEEAAEALMMQVHREGKAVAGVYTLDAAVSKVQKATQLARTYNFPLRLTYEEE
ncbi:ATP-dependent Clp protease adaptor ClpS [Prevotella sp. HUN102]|uniref:ATP-dependent Clp protease adaptor ClpS n=1 Tax=Prevotella sp. HUN102 TaxID=1392486 RepID=UPI00048C5229|nr:ATP-dependent Clp protease adaptor ClpS [Prevotella sp. HUN102]